MPVHLGSMGESVRTVIERRKDTLKPGDVYALNDPYHGGTHLPDITVITPVFDEKGRDLLYVASRGHPRRRRRHHPRLDAARQHPDRAGGRAARLRPLVEVAAPSARRSCASCSPPAPIPRATPTRTSATSRRRSPPTSRACASCTGWSSSSPRRCAPTCATSRTTPRSRCAAPSASCMTAASGWSWTTGPRSGWRSPSTTRRAPPPSISPAPAPSFPSNFNAPSAVCRAAVLYVFRTLVDDEIPMNEAACARSAS